MSKRISMMVGYAALIGIMIGSQASAGWEKQTPSFAMGELTDRFMHKVAFAGSDKILLFGGFDGANCDDTWEFDLSNEQWRNLTDIGTGPKPSARSRQGFCYIGDNKVLMYSGSNNQRDTWVYEITKKIWTRLSPSYVNGTPYYGYLMGMCYIGDDKALMYSDSNTTNTWIFDLSDNTWIKMAPTVVGGVLDYRSSMAFSYIGDDKAIMFSGYSKPNDTWIYDLSDNQWTKMTPVSTSPTKRYRAGMAYLGQDKVVLFSGYGVSNDTWIYDLSDNQWSNVSFDSLETPSARYQMAICYAGLGKAVMFGGTNGDKMDDTWVYIFPGIGQDDFAAEVFTHYIRLSWSVPTETEEAGYVVYKNNKPLSDVITIGTRDNGRFMFSFDDNAVVSGTLNRYKILEINQIMNSETFSPEITIPFCQ